jgi:hypothetical protein
MQTTATSARPLASASDASVVRAPVRLEFSIKLEPLVKMLIYFTQQVLDALAGDALFPWRRWLPSRLWIKDTLSGRFDLSNASGIHR